MKKLVMLGVVSFSTLSGISQAIPLIDFEISVGAIQQKPSGYVSYKPLGGADSIDIKRDANVSDKVKPLARLKFEHPVPIIPNLKLGYMPMQFEGRGTLTRDIRWGNVTYQANTDFELVVKADRFDATLYYNVPFINTATAGILDIEFGLNIRTVAFDGKLTGVDRATAQRVSESKSLTLPVPMGHLAAEIRPIPMLSAVGEVNYVGFGKNKYYDYKVGARLSAGGILTILMKPFVEVGYRNEKLEMDVSDVKNDLEIKGIYGLVGVRF